MKNIKKLALITVLGTGMFIPAIKAKNLDEKNINAQINILTTYNSYIQKLDQVKNLTDLKNWIKSFKKSIQESAKNLSRPEQKTIKNAFDKMENSIFAIPKLNDASCVYLAQALKMQLFAALYNK